MSACALGVGGADGEEGREGAAAAGGGPALAARQGPQP